MRSALPCFSPAFLIGTVLGYIDKGVWWSNAPFQSHLSSFLSLYVMLRATPNSHCPPVAGTCAVYTAPQKHYINLKQFWSKSDLSFLVVTWGLPWQAPAVSNASLHCFLEARQCMTLKPLPSSHTYVHHSHSHNNSLTSTRAWRILSAINNKVGISARSLFFCLSFLNILQSLLEGACIILRALIFYR